jgi:2-polyprenyl-3-methyl-5-hydroxy-6-metoxy-1,4-benzoquinol methylase
VRATAGDTATRCRICGAACEPRFSLAVARGRYTADYVECTACHALQVPDPYWLPEVYRDEALPPSSNADSGRFRRNFSAYVYLDALRRGGLFARSARVVDFGGGYGLLAQMLLDGGYDAWTTDEYVTRPFLAPHRQIDFAALGAGSADVITAFEVFEHLVDPLALGARLAAALRPGGVLVVSTGLYNPRLHDASWPYLAVEGGQHVTFWTTAALTHLARTLGFASVGLFPGDAGFLTVLSHRPPPDLDAVLRRARRALGAPSALGRAVAPWEFRTDGTVGDAVTVLGAGDTRVLGGGAGPARAPFARRVLRAAMRRLRGGAA